MLRRSIPNYAVMRPLVADFTAEFAGRFGRVLDVGTSRGQAIRAALRVCAPTVRFVGIDTSPAMLEAAERDLADAIAADRVELLLGGPESVAGQTFDVIQCVLVLMFIPLELRQEKVRRLYRALRPGGAMIVVEKLLAGDAKMERRLAGRYRRHKADAGYSWAQIDAKAESLQGVLVPLPEAALTGWLLKDFAAVECFWRWCNFAAYLCVK